MNTYTITESKHSRKFGYEPTSEDRMFCYLWLDVDHQDECKFGERWVKANLDPELDCWERIRDSLGVQKSRVDMGKIRLAAIFDMTAYGKIKAPDHLKKHGKMDDFIRPCIGAHRRGSEVHELPYHVAVERLTAELNVSSGAKSSVRLRDQQLENLNKALLGLYELALEGRGSASIVANLCPRFGKTLWALMLFNALANSFDTKVMVVPVYWLSAMSSFADEAKKFADFHDIEVIRFGEAGAQEAAYEAIQAGRRVLALVSLCGTLGDEPDSKWATNHEWIREFPKDHMFVFADEADFGSHTDGQRQKLEFLFG